MRLLLLLGVGLALIGAAWAVRSSAAFRESALRGKDLPELEAFVKDHPDDALGQYYLAKNYYLNRRFAEAQSAYEAVTRLEPDSARARLGLALSLSELGKIDQARVQLEKALQLNGKLAWAEYMLGKIYWQQGNTVEALAHVQRATQIDPRSDEAWYGVATCLTQLHRYEEAAAALQKALERKEASEKYHTALAELLVFQGDTEQGRRHYDRALEIAPNYGMACALAGSFYLKKGVGTEALDRAETLLVRASRAETLRPAEVFFDLGQLYVQKGQYAKAVEALNRSLRKDPRDERAYYALANAYRRLGDTKAAAATQARFSRISALHVRMQSLAAYASHNPTHAPTHLELARVYRDLGLIREAAPQFEAYLNLRPTEEAAKREYAAFVEEHLTSTANKQGSGFAFPALPARP